ncbi:MAG: hypothetical protein ACI9C1_001437 [Candidatus Aldehydirespiratoraceae bacterium]
MESSQDRFSKPEYFRLVHDFSNKADTVGIVILASLVPVLLWDDVAPERTIPWGITLALAAVITISTLPPEGPGVFRTAVRRL